MRWPFWAWTDGARNVMPPTVATVPPRSCRRLRRFTRWIPLAVVLLRSVPSNTLLDALKRKLATASTHPNQVCTCHMCSSGSLLPELLGKPDEKSFGAPDVAEPIRVFVLDHFADEFRAAFVEPGERIVDVLHGEHDAQVTESVHRGAAVIGDHRWREESGHLEPAVTVRRTHHGNLDAHVAQSSDAICPVSFDWGAPLELEAKFGEELNGGVDVFYHDADVVHTLDRHDVSLASNARPSAARAARRLQAVVRWLSRGFRITLKDEAAPGQQMNDDRRSANAPHADGK